MSHSEALIYSTSGADGVMGGWVDRWMAIVN